MNKEIKDSRETVGTQEIPSIDTSEEEQSQLELIL